jgi:hypothetical protein
MVLHWGITQLGAREMGPGDGGGAAWFWHDVIREAQRSDLALSAKMKGAKRARLLLRCRLP